MLTDFAPLVDVRAAGNRAMLRPSELAPDKAAFMRDLIAETFSPDQVTAMGGVRRSPT